MRQLLPLHGKRKVGRRSGDGFLAGHSLDTVHAEAQAMWDIRRLLSWVRAQGASQIGVLGLSLGGYNTALLASVEEDLACAIPGIPATDFARLLWEHSHDVEIRGMEEVGLTRDAVSEVFSVISPLVLEPKVAAKNRSIFAGVVDRLVPPEHVCALHEHWDRPRITWYQGGHVTFSRDSGVRQGIETTLRGADLIS